MVKYLQYSNGICKAAGWVRILVHDLEPKSSKIISIGNKHSISVSVSSTLKKKIELTSFRTNQKPTEPKTPDSSAN